MMEFIIKCPYCRYEHEGLDYTETGDMDGCFDMTCESEKCGEEFTVDFKFKVEFTVNK